MPTMSRAVAAAVLAVALAGCGGPADPKVVAEGVTDRGIVVVAEADTPLTALWYGPEGGDWRITDRELAGFTAARPVATAAGRVEFACLGAERRTASRPMRVRMDIAGRDRGTWTLPAAAAAPGSP